MTPRRLGKKGYKLQIIIMKVLFQNKTVNFL